MSDKALNQKIAELRHEWVNCMNEGPYYQEGPQRICVDYAPDYDLDWQACGPLLKELPCVGLYHARNDNTWGIAWDSPHLDEDRQINGVSTAQEVIARAWLMWKEQQK